MAATIQKSPQRRYDLLMKLIETGMIRSRQSLHSTDLVNASYGEDAAVVFGGTEMLAGTMDDMLDKMHEQVLKQDLPVYLEEQQIETLLDRVDRIVETLDREEAAQAQAEREDQESAIRAMDASLLPAGVTLDNVVDYHNYQRALAQKEQMANALQQVQDEIAALEKEQEEIKDHVDSKQQMLARTATVLNRSADICSMVVSS